MFSVEFARNCRLASGTTVTAEEPQCWTLVGAAGQRCAPQLARFVANRPSVMRGFMLRVAL